MTEPARDNVVAFPAQHIADPATGEILTTAEAQALLDKQARIIGEDKELLDLAKRNELKADRLNKALRTELNKAKEDAAEEATEDPDLVRRLVLYHYSQTSPDRIVKEPILMSNANAYYIRWLLQRCEYTAREVALMSVGMAANTYYQSHNLVSVQQMTTTKAAPPGRTTEIRMFDDEKVHRFLEAGKLLRGRGMKVTKAELGPILNAGRRTALLPLRGDQPTPSGRDRLHRRNGSIVGYVKITAAEIVAIEDLVDDTYARQAGHPDVDAYRDDWCRTHDAAWTGESAWLVTFSLEPHREVHRPMRGPWDPGDENRRRAPEPEQVDHRPAAADARAKWARDQAQREALYRAMPLEQKLRLVQQDQRLRILGRDDLRVIEARLEAIWKRGKAA